MKKDNTNFQDIDNASMAELKKMKASVSLPSRIGSKILFFYTLAVVALRVLGVSLTAEMLWAAEVIYIALAAILPFSVKHSNAVLQEESRMMALLAYSCSLAVIAIAIIF